MSIRIQWDNDEKSVLLFIYEGAWSIEDYRRIADETATRLSSIHHGVDMIIDFSASETIPRRMLDGFRYYEQLSVENQGINVIVNASPLMQSLIRIGRIIAPRMAKDVYFVQSREAARALIRRYRGK